MFMDLDMSMIPNLDDFELDVGYSGGLTFGEH